jgi:integrase
MQKRQCRSPNEGSLVEARPGVWRLRATVSGEKRQLRATVFGDRKEAAFKLRELISKSERGAPNNGRLSVATLCRQWLSSRKPRVGSRTWTAYRQHVDLWILPALDPREIILARDLRRSQIEKALIGWMTSKRHDSERRTISARTVHHIFSTLKSILRWGVRTRLLAADPSIAVDAPRFERREMRTLVATQIERLLEAASAYYPELTVPIAIATATGLRRGELLGLRWSDLDLNGARLTVRRALEVVKGSHGYDVREKPPKTKRSARSIALAPRVVDVLVAWREAQEMRHELLGIEPDIGAYVLDRSDGSSWEPWTFSAMFAALVRRAKIPRVRFHDLRHSYASLSLEAGIDLKTVSASLGHSSVSTTADLYMHLGEQLQKEHAARIDAVMGGALSVALPALESPKSRESHGAGLALRNPYNTRVPVVAPTGIEPVIRGPGRSR